MTALDWREHGARSFFVYEVATGPREAFFILGGMGRTNTFFFRGLEIAVAFV